MISEPKLDNSFNDGPFISNFNIFSDQNRNGGCIVLFIRDDVPAKVVSKLSRMGGCPTIFLTYKLHNLMKITSFQLGFTPCKAKHLQQGMELQ